MNKHIKVALGAFKNKDFQSSLESFEKALKKDKENPNIINNIGLCHLYLGDFKEAESHFLKVLELDSNLAQTYLNLADVYCRQKKNFEAIALLELATAQIPDDIVLKHYLARVYIDDTRYEDALVLLDYILDLSPKNYDAYWDLGQVYFALGDYYSAIANFEIVLGHIDSNELILYRTAEAYEANGEIDKAMSNYLKAISINDKFHPAYKKLAMMFLARDAKEDAIEYLKEYVQFELPKEEIDAVNKLLDKLNNSGD